MYGYPVIVTKNSTLGRIGVIPCIVRDEDGVILDHQVHWSVQKRRPDPEPVRFP